MTINIDLDSHKSDINMPELQNYLIENIIKIKFKYSNKNLSYNSIILSSNIFNLISDSPLFESKKYSSDNINFDNISKIKMGKIKDINIYIDINSKNNDIILTMDDSLIRENKINKILNKSHMDDFIKIHIISRFI